jgi:protease I
LGARGEQQALRDDGMVSAKGWTALAAFIRECLKVLGTEIHHGELAGVRLREPV